MLKNRKWMRFAGLVTILSLLAANVDMTAFAAEESPETEIAAQIQETEQTQETQSAYESDDNADVENVQTEDAETAVIESSVTQSSVEETVPAETTGVKAGETEPEKTETRETETETYAGEQPETPSSEMTTETEAVPDKETETVEKSETVTENTTETETETEMESVTEETETVTENMTETETETEIETATEEVKVNETENRLTFSDTDIAHGEYKEDGNDITWVIDENGKLTVEGTGNCVKPIHNGLVYSPCWTNSSSIKSAVINVKGMTIATSMFYECNNLTTVDLRGMDTVNVTDMSAMFFGCTSLTDVDLSGLDTGNVTRMAGMFCGCTSLTDVDLSGLDTGNVMDMRGMFHGCINLKNVNLKGLNTRNVTDMSRMFMGCSSLNEVDLKGLDTGNVTDMSEMFSHCHSLTNMDLSCLDTHNVTNMKGMFEQNGDADSKLTSVNLSGLKIGNVTNISYMFSCCSSLTSVNLDGLDTHNVTNMEGMFLYCSSLASVDVSGFDTGNVTNVYNMFAACNSLTEVDVSGFDTGNVTNMSGMFSHCSKLTNVDVSGFDTGNVTNMSGMFVECGELTNVDVSGFDTGNVIWMDNMFAWCPKLTSVDVSGFDTRNVKEMSQMFSNCSELTSVDVSGFDTGNVTNMESMFYNCSKLTSVDVSGFDTGNVTDSMCGMFYNCRSLTNVDVSHFNTEKVKMMGKMFKGCRSLTSLDLSSFDAGNLSPDFVESIRCKDMLSGCDSLTQLYTPRNLKEDIALEYTWYDIDGNSHTALPKEQTESMLLYRKVSPSEGSGRLTAKKGTTSFFCGDTLNTTDLTVIYYNTSGEAAVLAETDYTTNASGIDMLTAGTKTLTVTYQPSGGEALSTDILLNVKKKFDDTHVTVTLPGAESYSYVYDGSRKNPSPTVTYTADGETLTLKEKTDYTVSYRNNISSYKDGTDAAENAPTITVTGRGKYGGRVEKTFEIRKAAAPENEELTYEVTYFSSPQTVRISMNETFQKYKKVNCTVGTPVENDGISGNILASTPTTDSSMRRLTCSLNAGTAGDFVTIPVTFSFDNYEDAVLNVKIIFTGTPSAEKKKVKISGIEIKDSTYNKTPVSYTGTAKVISETDSTDVTGTVKLTYTYSGTQADNSAYTDTPNAPANAGSYKLTIAVSPDNKDYTGSIEYPFKITKAPLTITARDMGLKIGAPLPKQEDYLYDAAGLLTGDALTTAPALSCNITDTAKAGTYDIIASNADAGMNYEITYKNGTLTVSETGESTKYYTVTYNMNGHGNDITNTGVKEGSLLEKPQDPQEAGYTFTGWYKDQGCTVLWDFAKDTIQSDTTVYAGWAVTDNGDSGSNDSDDSAFEDTERTELSNVSAAIANIKAGVYDGTAYEPAIKVTANINGKKTTLTEGIDYRVLYTDHIKAGTATVTVKGNGIYKGSISKTYTINPRSVKKLKVITGSVAAAQTGADLASLPVYVYDGAKRLSYGTDFSLSGYSVTKSAAKVTVTGMGNYTGSMTAKLPLYNVASDKLLNPGNVDEIQPVSYNAGKAIKPEPVVTAGGARLVKNKDYKVQYQNNKNAGTAFAIVTGKGAYRGKVVVPFTIKAAQGTSGMTVKSISAKTYNGKYQRPVPSVTVSIGGKNKKLVKNKDYTVTYKNNRHAGTAEVLITGKGNYAGMTAKTTFTIKPRNITKASLKGTQGNLTLTYSKGILKQGADYEQPVYGEVKKNKIKVTIKGKGDFTGTMQKSVKLQ